MEPVGSTYNLPLTSDLRPDGRERVLRETSSGTTEQKADNAVSRAVTSGGSSGQRGIQPSEPAAEEFMPYSRSGTQGSAAVGDAKKQQGDTTQAGESGESQDPAVQAQILELKATEEKVKAHEAAHKSAGGTMTGPVSYSYTRGPDGKNYISGGEVPISVSSGKTPQETISRMQQVIRAALAPADPSPQDRAVAAQAVVQQEEARKQLSSVRTPGMSTSDFPETPDKNDKNVSRDSQRAYGNPAVSGKPPETADSRDPGRHAVSTSIGATRAVQDMASPADARTRPVSFYA